MTPEEKAFMENLIVFFGLLGEAAYKFAEAATTAKDALTELGDHVDKE